MRNGSQDVQNKACQIKVFKLAKCSTRPNFNFIYCQLKKKVEQMVDGNEKFAANISFY